MSLRKRLPTPISVCETHGGYGDVYKRVYDDVDAGIVFDKDIAKCEALAHQRPSWSVYQAQSEVALADGVGGHLLINLLDIDPYGEPWKVIEAWFSSSRPRAPVLGVVVNDGLRQKLRVQSGWNVHSMREACEHWGNAALHEQYLDICRWKLEQLAALARYRVTHWTGYYCGQADDITHYAAVLKLAA